MTTEEIGERMDVMLASPESWLIMRADGSEWFIQFQTCAEYKNRDDVEPMRYVVLLDLPCSVLDAGQSDRAFVAFGSRGVRGPQESHALDENGKPFMHACWKMNLGADSQRAVAVAVALFREIYQLHDDVPLYVEDELIDE